MKPTNIFEEQTPVLSFNAGTVIFAEGEPGTVMYVVRAGSVALLINGNPIETVPPGGLFGEMALIDDSPRTATARAESDCELMPINRQRFKFMVHEVPEFAIEVMKALSTRLRRLDGLLTNKP